MNLIIERPALFLLLSNLVTIVIALVEGWSAAEVMWIYWAQSIVIGFFNVLRILRLGDYSAEGVKMNEKPLENTPAAKRGVATFFALHYGLFHLGYFFFLQTGHPLPEGSDLLPLAACVGAFAVNHAFSYRENVEEDLKRRTNIGSVMFYPYKRIMPMHLTIILGGWFARDSPWVLVLFLSLKTAADLSMHLAEHGKFSISERAGDGAE